MGGEMLKNNTQEIILLSKLKILVDFHNSFSTDKINESLVF